MRCSHLLLALSLLFPLALFATSCATTAEEQAGMELCSHCGQIAGSEACCDADAATCADCGLAKGSPGCCMIEKDGENVALCSDCGMIKGAEGCCDADAMRCADCGMIKGSPGCCQ